MAKKSISTIQCLIIERHEWETGAEQQQLQIPLDVANYFFGPGTSPRRVTVRVFIPSTARSPAFEKRVSISREYPNGTRRVNGFVEIGSLGPCFIFFERTSDSGVYNVWWDRDKAIIGARFSDWQQGRGSQYGRGRLAVIVPGPVQRQIRQI